MTSHVRLSAAQPPLAKVDTTGAGAVAGRDASGQEGRRTLEGLRAHVSEARGQWESGGAVSRKPRVRSLYEGECRGACGIAACFLVVIWLLFIVAPAYATSGGLIAAGYRHTALSCSGHGSNNTCVHSDASRDASSLEWLQRLNELRSWAGLSAVVENPTWSNGCWLHARYMSENNYVGHSEDAANPWYTVEGFDAARASNCFLGVGGVSAIDGWATAPFHAVGMLDPCLSSTGFGTYSADGRRDAAALDVIRGRGPLPMGVSYPIAWPGPGSTTSLTRYWGGETPDPLSGTGWTNPVGLPIIVQFQDVPAITESHVTLDGVDLPHTVIAETTYSNADPNAQQLGRSVLAARHAIIIFPRTPLEGGRTYHVSLMDSGRTTEWSFSTAQVTPLPTPTPTPTPDTVAPRTTHEVTPAGADSAWCAGPVTFTFVASDPEPNASGVAYTEYIVDPGRLSSVNSPALSATGTHGESVTVGADGSSVVFYRSVDLAGNREAWHAVVAQIDAAPPTAAAAGADDSWHGRPVPIAISATDNAGGSGVNSLTFNIDGDTPRTVAAGTTAVTIAAPADHRNDGVHVLSYYATDRAGNQGSAQSVSVKIDTTGPTIATKPARGRVGKSITLRFCVADARSPQVLGIHVSVRNARGASVKSYSLVGSRAAGAWLSVNWKPAKKGTYRFVVTATDLAGNAQLAPGSGLVTVK